MRFVPAAALPLLAAAALAAPASASDVVSTRSVSDLTLGVNEKGEAMVTYTHGGRVVHVLAWGAINAVAPDDGRRQAAFQLRYDGGYRRYYRNDPAVKAALARLRSLQARMARATAAKDNPRRWALAPKIAATYAFLNRRRTAVLGYWKTFTCPAYDGPTLPWLVAACRAPDGSWWAVQRWPRKLPDYGASPTPTQAAMEVHLSHWTGPLPVVEIHLNWAYKRFDHLYGRLTYRGRPVYGFRSTPRGEPRDAYGRNVFVDTYDSAYGPGWRRENSFLTHNPNGTFCYGFYPHGGHPAGDGTRYRATIRGPGVTPDVMWEGTAPGPYDPAAQEAADRAILALHDPLCKRV